MPRLTFIVQKKDHQAKRRNPSFLVVELITEDLEDLPSSSLLRSFQHRLHVSLILPSYMMGSIESSSVLSFFKRVCGQHPDSVAVDDGTGGTLSYRQLDQQSSRLTHCLRQNGIKAGQVVPLLTSSCLEMVMAILGILKAGAVYVPIDLDQWPPERINYVLSRTNSGLVVYTGGHLHPRVNLKGDCRVIQAQIQPLPSVEQNDFDTDYATGPRSRLMCIIFTSGTTDKPKGVKIPHSSVARFVSSPGFNYDVVPGDRVLLVLSVAFDACMGTLFNTICNGGMVVLANRLNFQERSRNCTVLVVTPSILDVLSPPQSPTDYPHLDRIFLGGETPSQQLLETWSAFNNVALWLAYGPTEATCAVLTGRLRASHDTGRFNPTQLGHCIPGSSVILLNNDMETIEGNDMEGEICIEGPCLTDGYWQNVERTKDRFIEYHGRRIYRTGDLGRFVRTDAGDTVVSFCGRRDRVTKVRGFLVNLELDVDAGLRRLDSSITSVFSVVVDGKLCTAVVPVSVDCRHLQAAWRLAAPSYLVPDKVVAFNDLPLTANGKVNPREVIDRLRDSIHKDKPLGNGVSVNTLDTDESKDNGRHSSCLAIDQVVVEGLQSILGVSQSEIDLSQSAVFQGVHSLAAAKLSTFCRRHGYAVTVETILTEPSIHSLIDKSRYRRENGLDDQAVVQSPPIDTSPFSHGPITTLQKRMVLDSTVEDPKVNCIQHISRYKTEDIGKLREAWKSVVADEPIFQTCFDLDDRQPGNASQRLVGAGLFTWEEITITTPAAIEDNLRSLPSVTGLGSRFRVLHCVGPELPQKESIFVWAVHHALMDGYSASLVFEKVDNALQNEFFECSLPFTVAAHDIAEMQERMAPEVDLFWSEQEKQFPGAAGEPLIPETLTDNESVDFSEHVVETGIDNKRLRQAAQQAQATPAAIFYAAWAILLSCYTNSDTVVFGAVFSGRNLPFSWAPSMVGPLLNVLPLRCQIGRGMESASFVREIHQSIQQLSRFQVADRPADTPPFATTLTVQDAGLRSGTSAIRSLQPPQVKESNLLPLTVLVEADGRIAFLYRTDRFRAGHVKDMADIYTNLINALLEPGRNLQYAIDRRFPPEMNRAILHAGNIDVEATRVPSVNGGHTLTSLFGTAAALFPTHIAVEKGSHSITYSQFVRSAARVASVIQYRAQPGEVVAILADRSINWIIGIFGAMIANTVYCPLDASYTAQYQGDLLRRSHAKLLLVSKRSQMQYVDSGIAAIAIDEILASSVEPLCPWRRQTPSDAAYLCFTSGSTGVPKGVVCEHQGVVALQSCSLDARLQSRPGRRIAQFLSPGFDVCVHEVFASLCYGSTLVLRKDDDDPYSHLADVDVIAMNATVAGSLDPSEYPNLRYVYVAGEPIPQRTADQWAVGREMFNGYGPTEATIFVTMQRLQPKIPVNIGPPLPAVRAYILNDHRELQPPNTLGSIYVAGVQISRGYLDLPEVTSKTFYPDPFLPGSSERMYDTGDAGFWGLDGSINCCGRRDRQVKLRGFRINLDGVSNMASLRMPTVRHAAAVVKDGAIMLCVEPEDVDTEELRAHLKECLPPHAVPRTIHAIEHIPLSANGKLNIKSLVNMKFRKCTALSNGVSKKRKQQAVKKECNGTSNGWSNTNLQKLISEEWQCLLGLDPSHPPSSSDDFVLLGGDSIRQLTLAARLRAVLGLSIKVKDIIRASTFGDLVAVIAQLWEQQGGKNGINGVPPNVVRPVLGYRDLSPPETEWVDRYYHSQSQTAFNVPYVAHLSPAVDWETLSNALETVLNRHHVLKSQFIGGNNKTGERILSEKPIKVIRTTHPVDIPEVINRPFRLDGNEALVNAIVSPATLVLCISHVLCDLTAMDTLLSEVAAVYHGSDLQPVMREYFDVAWHQTVDPEKQRFWTDYLHGMGLHHIDRSNGASGDREMKNHKVRSYRGTSRTTSLPDNLYRRLVISSTKNGFTFHQFGMAVTGLVLHSLCGRDDVVLGCPFVNRPSVEDRQVIGLFLEPLPVRISVKAHNGIEKELCVHDFVRNVRQSSQSALAHSMPWSDLMQHLGLPFPSAQPQLFSCCVTFHDDRGTAPALAIDGVEGQHVSAEGAKFPLLVEWHAHWAVRGQDRLTMRLEYDTDWLSANFIEVIEALLMECFRILLEEGNRHHSQVKQRLREVLEHESTRLGVDENDMCEIARDCLMGI